MVPEACCFLEIVGHGSPISIFDSTLFNNPTSRRVHLSEMGICLASHRCTIT